MMFLGSQRLKIDEKGRFSLPSKWADGLTDREWMLTAGPGGCLLLLDRTSWQSQAERTTSDPFGSVKERRLRFLFVGHAEDARIDGSNRLTIPESLRAYADIQPMEGLVVVGVGDAVQIWGTGSWKQETESARQAEQLFDVPNDPGDSAREMETVPT